MLKEIEALEEEIRVKAWKLLQMRNEYLRRNGWEITSEDIGFTASYFYQKFGELYICEYEALGRELEEQQKG